MKKRLLSVFLCLCMVFGLVPATVCAETTNGHTHYLCGGSTCNGSGHENETYKTTFEKEIKQEGNTLKIGDKSWAPTKGSNDTFYILPTGTYYLGSDISPEYTIKIENNVTLCLNGHKITAADGMDAIYMTGGSFTLTDCKGVGTITHASSKTGRGVYVSSGTFNMYGGSITGNRATGDGGGVYKSGSNSSFNMYGGSITGNTANSYGGGVYVDGGGFTMSGGTIGGTKTGETNTATYGGGGVYAKANFEMTGGSITGNETNRGGGVYVTGKGSFTMSASADGQNIPSITGNNATENGGGVYVVGSSSTFKMTGGSIGGTNENDANTAYRGGGVCVDCSKFTMSASADGQNIPSITGNNATENGGGVYVIGSSSTFKMTGGTIGGTDANDANTATNGGGVCVGSGIFTVSGEVTVTDNTKGGTKGADGKFTGDTKNNVYLPTGKTITIGTDKLSEGAQLGVTVSGDYGDYTFTSGWNDNMSDKTPSDYFISDTDGYVAKLNGSELKMVTHVHNWTYTASGDTITATCKNCSNNNGNDFSGGSVTIQKPEKTKFNDGKDENAKVESVGWFGKAPSVAYAVKDGNALSAAPVNAGTYTAGITLGNVTVSVTYIIDKATQTAPTGLTTKGDIKNSGTGEIKNTAEDMEYNISANATTGWITCDNGSTRVAPATYYVRYKETDNYLASAVSAALTVKAHTHSGGNATCQKKAVCDGCGQEYGELGNHKFTETVSKMYLKSAATCQSPAVYYKSCLVCDEKSSETFEYGEKDFSNHIGNTYLVGQKEATCYAEGYTGDTYCSTCNHEIERGTSIAKNAHNPASVWTTDETDHWKECQTVGCGNIIDKAHHSGGEATCVNKAICEVCKIEYGDVDATNHKHTEVRGAKDATCCEKGYTGDTYCTDCNALISSGAEIPATGNHTDVDGKWESDGENHWHTCYFGTKFDVTAHTGGEATCVNKAICEVCKIEYGDVDATNHKHTEIRDAKPATEQEKGYTGDTWCIDCNKKITTGSEIAMLEHKLTLVEAKDATVTEQGNIKYYYCENCGKYFADVAGAKEISLSETVIQKFPPEIIEGNNATVNNGEKKSLTFRSNAAFADFIRVELDGKTLDEKDYTKAEGSIIVTLNNNFVSTLSVGEHTLGIVSESGTATAKFTVKASEIPNESPKTGDDNMVAVWSFAAVLSLAVLGFTTVVSKKKRAKEYLYKAYGSKLAALNKRRKKKRNTMKKAMLSAAIIITVAAAVILIIAQFGKKSNELVGTWRYDEHTQYVFEKDGTGKLLADDVTYSYAYTVKGKKLILDFTEDIVRDCDYTFSVNGTALTLIGGTGTDGGSYKLNKE